MGSGDPVVLLEISVQLARAHLTAGLFFRNLEYGRTTMVKQHIAVSIGPLYAAFIRVERRELVLNGIEINRFLNTPPVIRNQFAALMIGYAQEIHARGIHGIAVAVIQRAVSIAVP